MNKTCRGCNNELDNCTCDVLTTDRPESLEAKVLRDEIKNLRLIDASHRIENGELRERIKELEALIPTKEAPILTKDDIRLIKTALENESMRRYGNVKKDAPIFIRLAKLQKIIDKRG